MTELEPTYDQIASSRVALDAARRRLGDDRPADRCRDTA
jgi:hypothetical protein